MVSCLWSQWKKANLFLKKTQFKANYPLDDARFILDYYGCNK